MCVERQLDASDGRQNIASEREPATIKGRHAAIVVKDDNTLTHI